MSRMLVLFDIDGTLLRSQGVGVRAMREALCALHGEHITFDGVEVGGRLDVLIWGDVARKHGVEVCEANQAAFRALYGTMLRRHFDEGAVASLMPGVHELVAAVHQSRDMTLGVLTGNYAETGRLKIERAGLDPDWFVVGAWGDEGSSRRDLPRVAMDRYAARTGQPIPPGRVIIIGDTQHDVDCARHNGCRSIAVATGQVEAETLRACGPDLAVETLADTAGLMEWMRAGAVDGVVA